MSVTKAIETDLASIVNVRLLSTETGATLVKCSPPQHFNLSVPTSNTEIQSLKLLIYPLILKKPLMGHLFDFWMVWSPTRNAVDHGIIVPLYLSASLGFFSL